MEMTQKDQKNWRNNCFAQSFCDFNSMATNSGWNTTHTQKEVEKNWENGDGRMNSKELKMPTNNFLEGMERIRPLFIFLFFPLSPCIYVWVECKLYKIFIGEKLPSFLSPLFYDLIPLMNFKLSNLILRTLHSTLGEQIMKRQRNMSHFRMYLWLSMESMFSFPPSS